jgi:leucyl aminopeptidase
MQIRVERADAVEFETPVLAVGIFEGEGTPAGAVARLDERMQGQIGDVLRRGDFKGKEGETALLYPAKGGLAAERLLLLGLGKRESLDVERLRRAAGTAVRQASRLSAPRFAFLLEHSELVGDRVAPREAAQALAEAVVLATYVFDELKSREADSTPTDLEEVVLIGSDAAADGDAGDGVRIGAALGRAQNLARRLGNLPGNIATPTYLGETAERIGREHGMTVTLLGPAELEKEGLHTLLAVSRGSDEEPRLIVLEHRRGPASQRPLVLLGKGLTFDSGGISIKPAQGMEEMKFDMCGGAAVLGAMQAIGELDVQVNVIGVIPSSENLLAGSAMKPGDIIRSHLGKTIEIVNTDAEGRLILADALSYLRRFDPAAVIDAATLTGSCVIALGHHASAALGNDEALLDEIVKLGDRIGERVWPLPMYEEYREQIKSDYADIKNSGGRPAGTITAAWFLREFVGEYPWVHLDVAGTAWGDGKLSYQTKGSTGTPTRLFVEWVRSRVA